VYPYRLLNRLAFIEEQTRYRLDSDQPIRGASRHGVSEAFPLEGARSLYGMTKLASELMVEEYADAYGFRFLIDRCGLITGPRQMAKADQGVVALWMAAHYFRRPIQYIGFGGEGKQVRDFLHIDDFCDLMLEQIGNFDQYHGQTFNVGGGVAGSLSLLECTLLCEEITGNSISISKSAQDRSADVRIYITDSSKLSGVSGWRPKRDAKATLADIHDWLQAEESALKAMFVDT
jgi:CDP-paratose 2-epimerase